MRAGTLRHPVLIQELVAVDDDRGGKTFTPTTRFSQKAAIQPLEGSEHWEAARQDPKLTHAVTIRYRSGIKPKFRVAFGTRIFNIKFIINENERNRKLILMCEELVKT
jgi:SPP1 family predicted phage head-tail adaptor